jgi:hypothetical protein
MQHLSGRIDALGFAQQQAIDADDGIGTQHDRVGMLVCHRLGFAQRQTADVQLCRFSGQRLFIDGRGHDLKWNGAGRKQSLAAR